MDFNIVRLSIAKSSLRSIRFSTILLPPLLSAFSPNVRVPAPERNPLPSKIVEFIETKL